MKDGSPALFILLLTFVSLVLFPRQASMYLHLNILTSWLRTIGVLGLIWVGVAFITDKHTLLLPSARTAEALRVCRHYLGGLIVGLVLGLSVKRPRECRKSEVQPT
jgi:hypothetical protein